MYKLLPLIPLMTLSSPHQGYTYYFPLVLNIEPVGVAWYAAPASQGDARKIGAYWYYNSTSYLDGRHQAIPIIRPSNYEEVAGNLDHYSGWMLAGNEGEGASQDNLTPEEMAGFITAVHDLYPTAYLVCLNSHDIDYMLAVIDLLPPGTCQAYGVHVTHLVGEQPVSDWLDRLCLDCNIWITEIGWSNDWPDAYEHLYRLADEARRDGRVQMIFAYTTTDAIPPPVSMLAGDGGLLPNGRAFRDAVVEAYP